MAASKVVPEAPIVAVATPPGRGGIGIVRVSGRDLGALIDGVAGRALEPRSATLVAFRGCDHTAIDTGIALFFPAPHSYTGEDVVEWHGHGGPAVMRLLVARCVQLGARLAEPGEFTKRAFLNGKLDLVQAESVADVIEASTAAAVRAAARSLSGEFSREIGALREALVALRMYTEATLDFPDEDVEPLRDGDVDARLTAIRERLSRVLDRARAGAVLRDGLTVVLVGAPNVGKSSLLNRLVRDDAAIVTAVPGTTRDSIERLVEIGGVPVTVIDTAGLRETDDVVERLGIARAHAAIARADVVLWIVDARDAVARASVRLEPGTPAHARRVVVHNKCDLVPVDAHVTDGNARVPAGGACAAPPETHVWLSALTGEGVDLLESIVRRGAGTEMSTENAFLARTRQLAALDDAATHLASAARHAGGNAPAIELFAEDLHAAQRAFSSITGEFTADDLLGEIFSRFCIGK
ncbi:MAG: tRNA uridine-5-carboxymethylaminomethyl(34) synthesis GTPase MnmE [Betaproteobacteria bacterium]